MCEFAPARDRQAARAVETTEVVEITAIGAVVFGYFLPKQKVARSR
jgi:hypothetical protein